MVLAEKGNKGSQTGRGGWTRAVGWKYSGAWAGNKDQGMGSWEDEGGCGATRVPWQCMASLEGAGGTPAYSFSSDKPQKQCDLWIMRRRSHLPLGRPPYS